MSAPPSNPQRSLMLLIVFAAMNVDWVSDPG
jgi:hypothetical protein